MANKKGKFDVKNVDLKVVDSIVENVENVEAKANYNLKQIPLDKIAPHPNNDYPIGDLESLANSLKNEGQLHNAVVRPYKDPENTEIEYQLISGERRWRASRLAELPTLACKIVEVDDIEAEKMLRVANIETREINDLRRGEDLKKIAELVEEQKTKDPNKKGRVRDLVAKEVGMSTAQVGKLISLERLIPEFQKMVEEGQIPLEVSSQYALMTEAQQKVVYEAVKSGLEVSSKMAREIKEQMKKSQDEHDKVIKEMEEKLSNKDKELTEKEEEVKNLQKVIDTKKEEESSLKKELEEARKEAEKIKNDIEIEKQKIKEEIEKELKNNGDTENEAVKELKAKLDEATKKEKEATEKVAELKSQVESANEEVNSLIDEYEKKIKKAQTEKEKAEEKAKNPKIDNKAISNMEIQILAKQVRTNLSSLYAKVSSSINNTDFELSEEVKEALDYIQNLAQQIGNEVSKK